MCGIVLYSSQSHFSDVTSSEVKLCDVMFRIVLPSTVLFSLVNFIITILSRLVVWSAVRYSVVKSSIVKFIFRNHTYVLWGEVQPGSVKPCDVG